MTSEARQRLRKRNASRWPRALLALAALALAACRPEPAARTSYDCSDCSLLLISIDTLRADHLGTYGYDAPTSPRIDEWASRSVVFERAFSTAEKTADSHMSMFTGLHPSSHRILNSGGSSQTLRLSDGVETLAEVLQEAGFATAGFHGGGNVEGFYGFDRGFDRYQGTSELFEHPSVKVDRAIDWLDELSSERFLLFFHTYFVHDPYLPSPEFLGPSAAITPGLGLEEVQELVATGGFDSVRERFWAGVDGRNPEHVARLIALYDATIRETDQFIDRLIREVKARRPRTLVVLLSDHGEAFQEHGSFLHSELYNEVIHVPLIVDHPRVEEGRRIGEVVSLVDLAPTVLELLGQRALPRAVGQSFAGLLSTERRTAAGRRPAYAEKLWLPDDEAAVPAVAARSLVFPDRTKILLWGRGRLEFYDLAEDPGETSPSAGRGEVPPEKMRALTELGRRSEALGEEIYRGLGGERVEVDEEAQRQLRALGYVE